MDQTQLNQPAIDIDIAQSDEAREKIFRFRNKVENPDSGDGILKDELDENAILIYAESQGEIVASYRIVVASDMKVTDEMNKNYGLDNFKDFENKELSFTSMLHIDPKWRSTTLLGKILNISYRILRQKNIKFNFSDCSPALVQFFEHLGYRRYCNNFSKPGQGYRVPLLLITEDLKHLQIIKSPFLPIAEKFENTDATREWYTNTFPAYIGYVTERLIPIKEFWGFLSNRLTEASTALLNDLTDDEVKKFLSAGIVLHSKKGDIIVKKGDLGNEMFMILKGSAEVCEFKDNKKYSLAIFGEGEVFGEMAFLSETPRTADVVALEDMEILVLTQAFLKSFMKMMPETANKVLFNFSLILCERLKSNTSNLVTKLSDE